MPDLFASLPIGQLGAGGFVAIIVLLILTGRLVPRQQLLDKEADCASWRSSAEDWQRTATQLGMSMEKLLVLAETTHHALVEIQELAQRAADEGAR